MLCRTMQLARTKISNFCPYFQFLLPNTKQGVKERTVTWKNPSTTIACDMQESPGNVDLLMLTRARLESWLVVLSTYRASLMKSGATEPGVVCSLLRSSSNRNVSLFYLYMQYVMLASWFFLSERHNWERKYVICFKHCGFFKMTNLSSEKLKKTKSLLKLLESFMVFQQFSCIFL